MPLAIGASKKLSIKPIRKSKNTRGTTISQQLDALEAGIGPQLVRIAQTSRKFMAKYIDSKRKRRKNPNKMRLADGFRTGDIVFTKTGVSLGIGDKDYLDSLFPYWEILNYGGVINLPTKTGGVLGWFGRRQEPEEGNAGSQLFHHREYSPDVHLMVPRKPIVGIHYLEATNNWISAQWGSVWDAYAKKSEYSVPKIRMTKAVSKSSTSAGANAGLTQSDIAKLSY